jgi:acyl-CoA synthetase (AMP-forming)/AMP-acid ligase II
MTVVIAPKFDFVRFLESIVLYRVTHLMWGKCLLFLSGGVDACFRVVPPMAVLLAKHPATKNYDISHVRFLGIGAAPVSAELQEQVVKVIPNAEVGQAYGMTETCTVVSLFPLSQRIGTPGSAGVFIPGLRARIMKPDGTVARPGEQGELYVTGPSMALGYHNNEKACVKFHYVGAQ